MSREERYIRLEQGLATIATQVERAISHERDHGASAAVSVSQVMAWNRVHRVASSLPGIWLFVFAVSQASGSVTEQNSQAVTTRGRVDLVFGFAWHGLTP